MQLFGLALEATAPFLRFLDPGVGVGQIEILERSLQREAQIRAPGRGGFGIRLARAQVHRRLVFGEHAAAFGGEGRGVEGRVRSAYGGVAKLVVERQLLGARGTLQIVFEVPSVLGGRVQEALELRFRRHAQGIVAEGLQCRVEGADCFRRLVQQGLETREETRHVGAADQGADVVRLPQREADGQRDAVAPLQGGRHFERAAEDVDA